MLEKYMRPFFQRFLVDGLACRLAHLDFLRPSHITILGGILGILSAILVGLEKKIVGLFFLLLSGYCDMLDGTFARLKNQTSPFGTALDIVCDRMVEFTLILGFYQLHKASYPALFMIGSILICVTSFLVVGIFAENSTSKSFYYSPGLIERGEAFFLFGLMISFPPFFSYLAFLFTLLVFLTAGIRLFQFYKSCL